MLDLQTQIETDSVYDKFSRDRKLEQQAGTLPTWFSTGGYQIFKTKYLYGCRNYKEQIRRISDTAARHMPQDQQQWSDRFFTLFWNNWLSPSTPVLANMGTDRGLPVSCSGGYVADNVYSFYNGLTEAAVLSQNGFGTSGYLGDIRPRGARISKGGKASGVLPVIKQYVQMARDISQGGTRRGVWAAYTRIDGGDFKEVLNHLESHPDDLNIGWCVSDAFIERLRAGDEDAIWRWQETLRVKMTLGKGYYFFTDKVNRAAPQVYKDLGLKIHASNLCVAPETLVLTNSGHFPISSLAGKMVNVWNGTEFSNVEVKKTGENQKLLKVVTDSGQELSCTEYHKFYVVKSFGSSCVEVRAKDLKAGDKLLKFDLPVIEGTKTLPLAYESGFFTADGCEFQGKQIIYLYGAKKKLKDQFLSIKNWSDNQNRLTGYINGLKAKFFVPDATYTVADRLNWFAGYCDGDGTVSRNGSNQSLQVCSINEGFLKELQLMLQTVGVSSKVSPCHPAGRRSMPKNDGTGEHALYDCQASYRLLINSTGTQKLLELGFNPKRLVLSQHKPDRSATHFVRVLEVLDEGRTDDTYCFSEPKRHMGVFNGILTGQCTEIALASNEELTFTCVLSSMNSARYDEWKDSDAVFVATVFLDCVAAEFLERARNIKGLEKAVRFTEKSRALGLGQMGLFSLFQKRRIAPDSFEAHMLNAEVAKHIREQAECATHYLGDLLGEVEWTKGTGRRNTHLIAIAPTKTTATLMGGWTEGINPDPAMVFSASGAAGDIDRVNPVLLDLMKERKVFNKANIDAILADGGSVKNVPWLTDHEKNVFRTAFEIPQEVLIRYAATRQKYVDQAQSINLFFAHNDTEEYIAKVHQEAFMNPMIHSLYYVYSSSEIKAERTGECAACQ